MTISETRATDLRSALALLDAHPGELRRVTATVEAREELAAICKRVNAGGPLMPPVGREGPALLFENVAGFTMPVVAGVLASRRRAALLLGSTPERLPFDMLRALEHPVPPVMTSSAPCQDVVLRPPFDVRRLLPIPTHTALDAGPFLTLGLVRAHDPETGEANVSVHRLCPQGPDTFSIYLAPGRHMDRFRERAERAGAALPVSVSIGLDPAVYVGACFEPPAVAEGYDELSAAGALRGAPVELVRCLSVEAEAIARAEIVLEGEILPGVRIDEDANTHTGFSMPEYTGAMGIARAAVPVLRVTAITHRHQPLLQVLIGPGAERAYLGGIPAEAAILRAAERTAPGLVCGVFMHPAGGGRNLAVLQVAKRGTADDALTLAAARAAFAATSGLKLLLVVGHDVALFDSDDLLWALAARAARWDAGIADATVPYAAQAASARARFRDVDLARYGLDV